MAKKNLSVSGIEPNTKNKITNKLQVPNRKLQTGILLVIGHWDLFGLWDLSCGIYDSKLPLLPAMPD
jgi:hypothetical protein